MALSQPEVKRIGCVWSFILLQVTKIYLSWNILLKYFLDYLGSSVKTTNIIAVFFFLFFFLIFIQFTLGATDSSSAVSGFCEVFIVTPREKPLE